MHLRGSVVNFIWGWSLENTRAGIGDAATSRNTYYWGECIQWDCKGIGGLANVYNSTVYYFFPLWAGYERWRREERIKKMTGQCVGTTPITRWPIGSLSSYSWSASQSISWRTKDKGTRLHIVILLAKRRSFLI